LGPDRRTFRLAGLAAATASGAGTKGRNREKSMSTIIDIYCHIFPDRYFQEMTKAAPKLENIGKRRGVTKAGIEV
jgi:hypothetical protein